MVAQRQGVPAFDECVAQVLVDALQDPDPVPAGTRTVHDPRVLAAADHDAQRRQGHDQRHADPDVDPLVVETLLGCKGSFKDAPCQLAPTEGVRQHGNHRIRLQDRLEQQVGQHEPYAQVDQLLQIDHEEVVHEVRRAANAHVKPTPVVSKLHQPAERAGARHPRDPLAGREFRHRRGGHDHVAVRGEQECRDRADDAQPGFAAEGDDPTPHGKARDAGVDGERIEDVLFRVGREDVVVDQSAHGQRGDQERQVRVGETVAGFAGRSRGRSLPTVGGAPVTEELWLDVGPRTQEQLEDRDEVVSVVGNGQIPFPGYGTVTHDRQRPRQRASFPVLLFGGLARVRHQFKPVERGQWPSPESMFDVGSLSLIELGCHR